MLLDLLAPLCTVLHCRLSAQSCVQLLLLLRAAAARDHLHRVSSPARMHVCSWKASAHTELLTGCRHPDPSQPGVTCAAPCFQAPFCAASD